MKKHILKLVPCFFIIVSTVFNISFAYAAKTISELNQEKSKIQQQTQQVQNSLNQTKQQKSSALKEVERLDEQLGIAQAELDRLTNELDATKIKLSNTENELKEAIEDKENQYDMLKKRIRFMYESGSSGYLQVILEADSFSDLFRRVEYVDSIMTYDQDVLDKYEQTEQIIHDNVETIKVEKANIEQLSKKQSEKKAELDESLKNKEAMVAELAKQESTYQQQLNDLDKADKDVEALIAKAQAEIEAQKKRAAEEAARKAKSSSGNSGGAAKSYSNKVYSYSGGSLQYPVPAYSGYPPNSPYGYRSSPISGKSEFHTGVDLKATRNTDIIAAEGGTVIFAGAKGGYGNTVIIDHGGGMSTLYAHNTSLCVSSGQSVQRGQVIAKAGTTGYSTGVHSHFEVRINGKHTDPMPYLRG